MVFEREVAPDAALLATELGRHGVRVTALVAGSGIGGLAALRGALRATDRLAVVHAYGLRAAFAVSLARPGGTPFVISLAEAPRSAGARALLSRAVNRGVVPAAAAVLAPTPELVQTATRLGAREARLLPPPLPDPPVLTRTSEEVREELALPPAGPIVLAAARLHPDTRLDVLIAAASRWRGWRPRPEVVLVGAGPAYRPLVAQATVARAAVTFAGDRTDVVADRTVSEADGGGGQPASDSPPERRASLPELLAAATVAVVTDPWARPDFALAAARAGVALVVPQGGTVAGLFAEGVVTVAPGDVEALDEAVQALLDDPETRVALAVAARDGVAAWPDAATVAGELAGLYERVSLDTLAEATDTPG